MAETAANWIDHILPSRAPLRQWVLTLPFDLRARVAFDRELLGRVTRLFADSVLSFYRRTMRDLYRVGKGESGAITVVQRVNSDLRFYFVRYADDFVLAFQNGNEAKILRARLRRRLEAFGLTLNEQKTRLIRFGRYAREQRAGRKPDTFDFLGFTHIASTNQKGWFHLHRITAQKKRKAKYDELRGEIVRRRHAPVAETHAWLSRVLVGHYNYYGVPGNEVAMQRFRGQLQRAWYRQLERRSQRGHKTVAEWQKFEKHYELPRPRVVHPWPDQRFEAR